MKMFAALAAILLAAGLVACGGGDGSNSSSTEAGAQGQGAEGTTGGGGATHDKAKGDEAESGSSGGGKGQSGGGSDFTPKQHSDSGGGSAQFKVKGGDNSVQEFGEEAGTSEADAAAAALHNFLDARAEGNWAAACEYLSKPARESFEKLASQAKRIEDKSCSGILEKLTNPAAKQAMKAEAAKADVGSLRVDGDRSFVIYTGVGGTILAMPMADEGGEWKVSSLAGTPLN